MITDTLEKSFDLPGKREDTLVKSGDQQTGYTHEDEEDDEEKEQRSQ